MALGKGIPVINAFDLNSKLPLDSRTVVDTAEEMNALVTNESVGDGQLCYCKADKKLYVLKEGVWSEVGGGGGGGIPVVEGTFSETTEEGAQFTVNIPQAQSDVFILSLPDIASYFIIGSFVGEYIGNFISKNDDNPDELIINYCSGRDTTINLYSKSLLNGGGGNIVTIEVTSMPDTQTTIDVSAITNDTQFVNIKETSTNKNYLLYRVGSDFASCFSNELTQGKIVAYYYINTQQKQLYYFISSVGKIGKIFGNHDIQVPAVSSNNILPCTTADNGKVLSVVNGEAQWASVDGSGSGGTKFDIVQFSDDGVSYTGTITGSNPIILKTDWDFIVPKKYTYIDGLINSCQVIDNNKVTTYSFNNGKYTSQFSFIFYMHFITLTNSTDSIYIQYPTSNPDYKEPLDMTQLKRVLSGKKALCSGVLGNSAETRARPLYVAGNAQLTVYYVLNSNTDGTISEKSIENYTISDVVTPVE